MLNEETARAEGTGRSLAGVLDSSPHSSSADSFQVRSKFPPGLVGDVAEYIYNQSAYSNLDIALAAAIGFLSGLCGQRFNTYTGAGLNQYILVLAQTGRGKEAIAEGTTRLLEAVKGKVEAGEGGTPHVVTFKGPGHFASAEGLLKQLSRSSCFFSIIGEFGIKLKQLIAPNASATSAALKAAILDLYNKSGDGKVLDPMVYSDTAKNTSPVQSPSFTLIGESTPAEFYDGIDERIVTNGLAQRFLIWNVNAPRPYLNPNVGMKPAPELVSRLSDLVATCCTYSPARGATKVKLDAEASAVFSGFERQTTDTVNANVSNVHSELWNRALIKALKLASLIAVGINPHAPLVTGDVARGAIALVSGQIDFLTRKFEAGDFGSEAGNVNKQQQLVLWAISDFFLNYANLERYYPYQEAYKYVGRYTVPYAHISQRIARYAAFKNDKRGATNALQTTIKELLSMDFIREVPPTQMAAEFDGNKGRGFRIQNPEAVYRIAKYHKGAG